MIEVYGVLMKNLPDRDTMRAELPRDLYDVWRSRHKRIRDEFVFRTSISGMYLLNYCMPGVLPIYGGNGRPHLQDPTCDFNITHTTSATFLAVERIDPTHTSGGARVGIDAEDLSRIASVRICPMAARWFSQNEYQSFLNSPDDHAFLRIWTQKEALVKWTGEGLRQLRETDTTYAAQMHGVSFCEYTVEQTLVTVCARKGASFPREIRMLERTDLFPD